MAFTIDENYMIKVHQGDTWNLEVDSLPNDKSYTVFFRIRDIDSNKLLSDEVEMTTGGASNIVMPIPASVTDKLLIPRGQSFKDFYWGLKTCDVATGAENTHFLGDTTFGSKYKIRVFTKEAEGIV